MQIGDISEYYIENPSQLERLNDHYDTLIKVRNILIVIIGLIVLTSYNELGREIGTVLINSGLFTN